MIGIGSITLFSSFGAFLRYILPGHDLAFHLLRIEGLKDALMLGDIPCKIQTNWCNGWGYAVSAIYGDISILLPSIMRLCGFTLQTSYHSFVFFVNLLTAVSAYYCFLKISKNKKISMITAFLYTAAPYRLCNICFVPLPSQQHPYLRDFRIRIFWYFRLPYLSFPIFLYSTMSAKVLLVSAISSAGSSSTWNPTFPA